jgi:hypothetical protein
MRRLLPVVSQNLSWADRYQFWLQINLNFFGVLRRQVFDASSLLLIAQCHFPSALLPLLLHYLSYCCVH